MTGDAPRPKQRSLHCSPEEQEAIRARAAAAGRTVSRHVLELARADAPERHPLILSGAEQAELRDGVAELRALVRAARAALPGDADLAGALARLSRKDGE